MPDLRRMDHLGRSGPTRTGGMVSRYQPQVYRPTSTQPAHSRATSAESLPQFQGRTEARSKEEEDEAEDMRRASDEEPQKEKRSRIPLLEKDISMIMRQRAEKHYGLDPSRNRRLVADGVAELWSWIEHTATMATGGRAFVENFDFGFKGVLPILRGFPPHEPASPAPAPKDQAHSRRSRTVSQPSGPTVFEDVRSSSIKRSDVARAHDAAFARAAAALNKKNGSTPFTISSKPAQRQLALSSIGPDFASADVAAVIKRYENLNQPSKAAAWALFSGKIDLAIRSLKSNKGGHLSNEVTYRG